jgi:hypothetical protein
MNIVYILYSWRTNVPWMTGIQLKGKKEKEEQQRKNRKGVNISCDSLQKIFTPHVWTGFSQRSRAVPMN